MPSHDDFHPYFDGDIEEVDTATLNPGDLLAGRGAVGTGRWAGNRIDTITEVAESRHLTGYRWAATFTGDKPEWPPTLLPARTYRIRPDRIRPV